MLIAFDIGNSSIRIGYFTPSGLLVQRLETHPLLSSGEYAREIGRFMDLNLIEKRTLRCIICSVVESHTAAMTEAAAVIAGSAGNVSVVPDDIQGSLRVKIDDPGNLGADRLANAEAAFGILQRAVAVIDFGTATTVTVVNDHGELMGGAIMPGLGLMSSSLGTGTSRLTEVLLEPPDQALGKDTGSCIRTGLFFGTAGAVERIVDEIEMDTGILFSTIITGGHSAAMQRYMNRLCERRPDLIFEGLRFMYEKNRTE